MRFCLQEGLCQQRFAEGWGLLRRWIRTWRFPSGKQSMPIGKLGSYRAHFPLPCATEHWSSKAFVEIQRSSNPDPAQKAKPLCAAFSSDFVAPSTIKGPGQGHDPYHIAEERLWCGRCREVGMANWVELDEWIIIPIGNTNTLFGCEVGSKAYRITSEISDIDRSNPPRWVITKSKSRYNLRNRATHINDYATAAATKSLLQRGCSAADTTKYIEAAKRIVLECSTEAIADFLHR